MLDESHPAPGVKRTVIEAREAESARDVVKRAPLRTERNVRVRSLRFESR